MVSSENAFLIETYYQEMFSFMKAWEPIMRKKDGEEISHSQAQCVSEILLEFLERETQLPCKYSISAYGI